MTLSEIATHACLSFGLSDTATLELAKAFARTRYAMLWGQHNWRQSLVTTTVAVNAGTATVTLPSAFERAVAVRWDGRLLGGVDHGAALQLMPDTFDTQGNPIGFIELPTDDSLQPQLQLIQVPATAGTLYVLGKRRCPGLPADTSVPMLAGADAALCAYTLGDLWRWQHQFSKADSCFGEGGQHLTKMIEQERAHAATTQRIIPDDGVGSFTFSSWSSFP